MDADSRATHTPGPWWAIKPERSRLRWSVESGEAFIADLNSSRETDAGLVGLPRDEQAANARLIAAAPDLLLALRIGVGAMKDGASEVVRAAWVAMADAAVAKAEAKS